MATMHRISEYYYKEKAHWHVSITMRTLWKRSISFYFLMIVLLGLPAVVFATHKADHRYTISGYVRDDIGNPLRGIKVTLKHKDEEKKVTTNRRGYYQALFHLHNENLGEEIIVTVEEEVKKITATFDPNDRASERWGGG